MLEKECPKCNQIKAISNNFSKCCSRRDGYQAWCKLCIREVQQALPPLTIEKRRKNAERYREWAEPRRVALREKRAVWYREHAEERRAKAREYYHVNKLKKRAHGIVREALKNGTLVKPASCSKCGKLSEHIEGHHDDYEQPLVVEWLCISCHRRLNSEL